MCCYRAADRCCVLHLQCFRRQASARNYNKINFNPLLFLSNYDGASTANEERKKKEKIIAHGQLI